MYNNDDSDKHLRKRNYYLQVFLLPILAAATLLALIFWLNHSGYFNQLDVNVSYGIIVVIGFMLYSYNHGKWVKMPDGGIYHRASIHHSKSLTEPAEYVAEYFVSGITKVTYLVAGILMIGFAIWMANYQPISILLTIFAAIPGVVFCYLGIRNILDKKPRLKIARKGIWTNRLGFVEWKNVVRTSVVDEGTGEDRKMHLDIYLKGTFYARANIPDDQIDLLPIKERKEIEKLINECRNAGAEKQKGKAG